MFRSARLLSAGMLALGVLATAPACASTHYGYPRARDRGVYDRGGYGSYRQIERIGYDNGFREGVREGERDGNRRRRYEPTRHDQWRDADRGYRREYGDHNLYRRSYRNGFEAGYSQGYRRYGYDQYDQYRRR